VKDYILELSFDARDAALDETIQSHLFLTPSTGSTSSEAGGTTTVAAYFDSPEERDEAASGFRDLAGVELHFSERDRVDWLDLYQQSLEPLYIGSRFVVVPDPALLPADSDRLTIIVPQEQAFGTGSHETTSLCIEMLETLPLGGKRGLDVGSGSGILALAMLRLGARRAIAFDNDNDAFAALRDNRIRNSVSEASMPVFIGGTDALRGGTFDAVTMNIIPEVILPLLDDVRNLVAESGVLILSGILLVKRDEVVDAAHAHGLELERERWKGEWWAGLFTRSPRKPADRLVSRG
jgi:ribosomal protein L11 methyltransferase